MALEVSSGGHSFAAPALLDDGRRGEARSLTGGHCRSSQKAQNSPPESHSGKCRLPFVDVLFDNSSAPEGANTTHGDWHQHLRKTDVTKDPTVARLPLRYLSTRGRGGSTLASDPPCFEIGAAHLHGSQDNMLTCCWCPVNPSHYRI